MASLTDGLRHDACELVVVELAVAVEVGLAHELLRLGRRQGLTHPRAKTKASLSAAPLSGRNRFLLRLFLRLLGFKFGGRHLLLS